jgi:hypothetical protein
MGWLEIWKPEGMGKSKKHNVMSERDLTRVDHVSTLIDNYGFAAKRARGSSPDGDATPSVEHAHHTVVANAAHEHYTKARNAAIGGADNAEVVNDTLNQRWNDGMAASRRF